MTIPDWQAHCLLTTAQMAAADRAAIAAGTPGIDLMEAAGAAVAREIRLRWRPRPAAILCGPGNNGGDGFVIARLLLESGWSVSVLHAPHPERLHGDARTAFDRWTATAGAGGKPAETVEWSTGGLDRGILDRAELIVDALFGAGLTRPVAGAPAELLVRAAARRRNGGVPVVAVDVPSGVDGDSGACRGPVAPADLTVTFFRAKPGHYLLPGKEMCGALAVCGIGIDDAVLELDAVAPQTAVNAPALWRRALRPPAPEDHKYTRGHVLVVAGEMPGASALAARAAARAGAGMVTVGWFPEDDAAARPFFDARLPAAILRRNLGETGDLAQFCRERKVQTILAGQGFGRGAGRRQKLAEIARLPPSCILDADALFPDVPVLDGQSGPPDAGTVLTPHAGEFERLAGAGDAGAGKVGRTRRAAAETGATIIHKGYDTVIAAPDGRAAIGANALPGLASAGTGDVLAGIVAGLRAQGMPPFEAACAAVWCHAESARLCGPGLLADDLPDRLPEALSVAFGRAPVR
ncbi:MAG: NAD(P)H-hydrate dehydratase [Rhodospirillaceae bacterium]|nr:NAD(P)H-hydrate dehydratase [Rhodospirillaceae bacterium]MYB12508.1 NAD(P)H-hydrate dehydratase [Rhodospirillaceae bacterium]